MKKLSSFRPARIRPYFFPHAKSPKEINFGECFIWAYIAHLLHKDVEIWYVDCHAFVRYRGRFYDSETLRGTPDWRDLPACAGFIVPAERYSADTFKRDWRRQPKKFNTTFKQIESDARKYLRYV